MRLSKAYKVRAPLILYKLAARVTSHIAEAGSHTPQTLPFRAIRRCSRERASAQLLQLAEKSPDRAGDSFSYSSTSGFTSVHMQMRDLIASFRCNIDLSN